MRILGLGVCGPGEANRYMEETLKEFKRLCDDVIICLCNAGEKEEAFLRKYQFRYYKDNREWGRWQPALKTDLLKRAVQLEMDWHLVLDMDETMPTVDRQELERLSKNRESCQFHVVELWNDLDHYMKSLGFYNVRFYKNVSGMETQFLRKPVHCGNAPPYFYCLPAKKTYIPHILLHKGLMLREDRLRKIERYKLYDPRAVHKGEDYYNALSSEGSGTEYHQGLMLETLRNYCNKIYGDGK